MRQVVGLVPCVDVPVTRSRANRLVLRAIRETREDLDAGAARQVRARLSVVGQLEGQQEIVAGLDVPDAHR